MNKYVKLSSPFVIVLSLILILCFKTVPSGKLWKSYSVLCVPATTQDSIVQNAIETAGIKDSVSLSRQYLPISLSENSIEISMLRLNYASPEYSYLNKRNAMFFDKSNTYRLYYIPTAYSAEINTVIKQLEAQGINCIKDSSANYPWILPIIGILLAIMLSLFSKHKLPFIFSSIIPLVFLYSNPFYPIATATCLTLLILFFISNLWRRKGAITILLHKHSAPAMLAIAFICAFSSSLSSGFLFIIAVIGTGATLLCYAYCELIIRNKKYFVPVYIRSAKRVSFFADKTTTIMSIVTGAAVLFIILIFITSSHTITNNSAKLLFPAKSANNDSALPQFEEYYRWNWNVRTFPYKSINNTEDQEENTVSFNSYLEDTNTGIITEQTQTLTYDDNFRKSVFDEIDNLQFNSVEKIMKSEGEDFCGGYTATSSYQINLFGIIMCFICLFILLFIYISIIIRKGINK